MLNRELQEKVFDAQRNELTESIVYKKLAAIVKDKRQADILEKISREELDHYGMFKAFTRKDAPPKKFKVFIYVFISRIFGLSFGLKLMENGECLAQDAYAGLKEALPEIGKTVEEEKEHEAALLKLIDEDRLKYVSSVVLGLNDALIEFAASLAGYTLALQHSKLIGIVGLITGVAASASMAASEYLSVKHEETGKDPVKASIYTGVAYIIVVTLLVLPYFLFKNVFLDLGLVICTVLLVIFIFTFYVSTAKGLDFRKRFLEMAGISLVTASITFLIGLAIRNIFKVEV
ncbi:MAG: VIT1/CCC1 family protein [Candidatus Omnitrophica bacterium]|nr:VIT1/CCC1 family protein [Candidatus Omnitrophota bacterium]